MRYYIRRIFYNYYSYQPWRLLIDWIYVCITNYEYRSHKEATFDWRTRICTKGGSNQSIKSRFIKMIHPFSLHRCHRRHCILFFCCSMLFRHFICHNCFYCYLNGRYFRFHTMIIVFFSTIMVDFDREFHVALPCPLQGRVVRLHMVDFKSWSFSKALKT